MKHLIIIVLFLCLAIPSFGQFRNGIMDRTGGKPVLRKDLNYQTAPTLLSAEDCSQYLLGNKLFKAGAISAGCGTLVVCAATIVMLDAAGSEFVSLIHSVPNGGNGANMTLETTYERLLPCFYIGVGAAVAGCGLMIAGSIKQVKISNKYFREHPYGELSFRASPTSLGLCFNF